MENYRFPAEWEPHACTWVSWPHNRDTWPGVFRQVADEFATMVRAIAAFEPVCVLAGGAAMSQAQQHLEGTAGVSLFDIQTNDAWARDHGPTFLARTTSTVEPALLDWQYNAWGGKYPPFDHDNAVPGRIAAATGHRVVQPQGIVLEGGAIETNGAGVLLTTRSCLLDPARNADITQQQMEAVLRKHLGIQTVLWLSGADLPGDDTDGHIDQVARFVSENHLLVAVEEDQSSDNFLPLQQNLQELRAMRINGKALQITLLPMPRAMYNQGQRLPASYANFYIVNGGVVVPQYGDPADAGACRIIGQAFPSRRVTGVPASTLVCGLGSVHCLTQQQPSDG